MKLGGKASGDEPIRRGDKITAGVPLVKLIKRKLAETAELVMLGRTRSVAAEQFRRLKTVLVNGRISYRSFPRYRLIKPFFRRVLADVDRFCVQGEETARRLTQLGADPAKITLTGRLLQSITRLLQRVKADDRAGQQHQRVEPLRGALVADPEPPEAAQPRSGALDRPPVAAKPG